ncbi:cation:proton antiporter [Nocardia sp. BMG51109]|uniref:cation:proton antiporter n=1 Tax=Nocardia sp. BMG51109 TaxID=1056816 RepID=UPI0004BBE8A4|nr:cation:proton antiporter [Nocardia sp. BMG51109]
MAARVFGWMAERIGQPPVVGEITAGILAGPTILGTCLSASVFPPDVRPSIAALANVGITLFMFVAGLGTDMRVFSQARNTVLVVSLSAYAAPFALGCGVAATVLARHHSIGQAEFVAFVGCALAVTAFPVLARILHDRRMFDTPAGQLALGCAAVEDVLAWVLLAAIIATADTGNHQQWRLLLLIPLLAGTRWIVRPLLTRTAKDTNDVSAWLVAVCGALLWGAATEWAGLHLIFGAFLFGVAFPSELRAAADAGIQPLAQLLLPCFFVIAGLQVDLTSIDTAAAAELAALITCAVVGKAGAAYLAARLTGTSAQDARILAVLLNTRGLTELILLNVGMAAGIIGSQLYSLLVVMALVTTAATAPLLNAVRSVEAGG